jgi:2-dehydro-3-deoxygluconokinase
MAGKAVATFGEIMLRLSPPDFQLIGQNHSYDALYGGGEANVAISLAIFQDKSIYVTCLPDNAVGQGAVNFLRQHGVDTRFIQRSGSRVGIYFLEIGAAQRPSRVIYDRGHASIAEVKPGSIDWNAVFAECDWFHVTGITPAISAGAAEVSLEAVKTARKLGLTVSVDLNYRKNLWKWGKTAGEVMPGLVELADVAIGNEEDAEKVFGIHAPKSDVLAGKVDAEDYRTVAVKLVEKFPNLERVAITLRGSISASHNTWSGILYDARTKKMSVGKTYDMTHIVDRVGGGDAFAAGIIHSLRAGVPDADAIEFAVAASCLKHSIVGDSNLVTVQMVNELLKSGGSGRVQR